MTSKAGRVIFKHLLAERALPYLKAGGYVLQDKSHPGWFFTWRLFDHNGSEVAYLTSDEMEVLDRRYGVRPAPDRQLPCVWRLRGYRGGEMMPFGWSDEEWQRAIDEMKKVSRASAEFDRAEAQAASESRKDVNTFKVTPKQVQKALSLAIEELAQKAVNWDQFTAQFSHLLEPYGITIKGREDMWLVSKDGLAYGAAKTNAPDAMMHAIQLYAQIHAQEAIGAGHHE